MSKRSTVVFALLALTAQFVVQTAARGVSGLNLEAPSFPKWPDAYTVRDAVLSTMFLGRPWASLRAVPSVEERQTLMYIA